MQIKKDSTFNINNFTTPVILRKFLHDKFLSHQIHFSFKYFHEWFSIKLTPTCDFFVCPSFDNQASK
jgi:hypothetical protein